MFTLRDYQQRALDSLQLYFQKFVSLRDADTAFYLVTRELRGRGLPYRNVAELPGLPYVCIRIPTGGGKTLVACHAVSVAAQHLLETEHPLVLWLTPSTAIRDQTLDALKNRRHPYRQALDATLGSVNPITVGEALFMTRAAAEASSTIIVSTIQAFRVEETEGRKVYDDSGYLMDHFRDRPAERMAGLESFENGTPKRSLANVLRLYRPVIIVDEAHNARTDLSFDTLARFNPSCIIEFTATPDSKAHPSNVLHSSSVAELYAEKMIKMPIKLETRPNWEELLTDAVAMRRALEKEAEKERVATEEYLRPIMLLQAQPRSRHEERLTADVLKQKLIHDHRVPENHIVIATGETDELPSDILSAACPVRYVITVQKLREGWDCPFAYVLCSVAELHATTAVEQILGRIMRLPKTTPKKHEKLNAAYAFVASQGFLEAAKALKDGLIENGFDRKEAEDYIKPLEAPPGGLPLFEGVDVGDAQRRVQLSPAERGIPFSIPVLAFRQGNLLEQLDEEHLSDGKWDLTDADPRLTEAEFSSERALGQYGEVTVGQKRDLEIRFLENLHEQLFGLLSPEPWTIPQLANWLDHNIYHPEFEPEDSGIFLLRVVRQLVEARVMSLDVLTRDKYRLREACRRKMQAHSERLCRTAFQSLLALSGERRVEVTPERCFQYNPLEYPYSERYTEGFPFNKHYYKEVGAFDSREEEECAQFLDTREEIEFWVRNIANRPAHSFWLTTSPGRFYPDFVCRLTNQDKYLVVEYKGADRWTQEEEEFKRWIGELWEARSNGHCLFVMPRGKDFDAIRAKLTAGGRR